MATLNQNSHAINSKSQHVVYHRGLLEDTDISQYEVAYTNDISSEHKLNDLDDTSQDEEEYDVEAGSNANSDGKKLKKIFNDVVYHEKNIKRNLKRLQKEYSVCHAALTKAEEIKKLLIEFDTDKVDNFEKHEDQRKTINGLLDIFQALLLQTDLQQMQLREENKKLKQENKQLTEKLKASEENEMILAEEYQRNIIDFDGQIQKYKDQIEQLKNEKGDSNGNTNTEITER